MTGPNKQTDRFLNLSFAEASFALVGVAQKIDAMGATRAGAFWGDVTDALCRIVMHDIKTPTRSKRTEKIARRDTIATCVLARHYNDDYTMPERLGCILTAVQHVACRPDYRLLFEENKADYFFDTSHFHAFDTHPPVRITVAEPHSAVYNFFHADARLTEPMEKAVRDLLRDEGDEADPFAAAITDSNIDDARKAPASIAAFAADTRAMWTDMRAQLPRVTRHALPKAS